MLTSRTTLAALLICCGTALPLPLHAREVSQPSTQPANPPSAAAKVAANTPAEQLPIKSITLYRSGVASLERRGMIDGSPTVQLRFDTDQINDILKSMVVLDLSKQGRVSGVSYASRDPLAKRLTSFGVNISDEPSLSTLLTRLRGATIAITLPDVTYTGTIIGGEVRQQASGAATAPIAVPYINILTSGGIRSVSLASATNIEILDKKLAAELQLALAAVAEHRADTTKTVDVSFVGEGARQVVIAYVQEAPVWKATYRLVLPDFVPGEAQPAPASKFTMQGWAIVENTTDEDWNAVDLSLVSGQPVSFRMDLYQPLYAIRPLIPVPTVPGVGPRIFEGGTASEANGGFGASPRHDGVEEFTADATAAPGPSPSNSLALRSKAGESRGGIVASEMIEYGAQAQARAVESGEIFEYRLEHPVTVERQRSAMLPIISAGLTGNRVSIYALNEDNAHPMRGIELTNDSGLQLLPGPISVYDGGTYAGDSQIGHVPAGDKRLLAYSVDLEVTSQIDSSNFSRIQSVSIVRGLLQSTTTSRIEYKATYTNKDPKRARTLIIERPRQATWKLDASVKPYESTTTLDRFKVQLAKGASAILNLAYDRTDFSSAEVISTPIESLLAYRTKGAKISEAVLDAIRQAQRLAATAANVRQSIQQLAEEKNNIDIDQTRIRQNIGSVDRASSLYATYMKKLTDQEARIETLQTKQREAETALTSAEQALNDYLTNLTVQ